MALRLRDLPTLVRSHVGRRRLLGEVYVRMYRPLFVLGTAYRCTVARSVRWIAVTGSFGKTTTTRALLLALGGRLHSRIGWNTRTSLAYNVFHVKPRDPYSVVEVGIDGPRQMAGIAGLIRPHVVVVTSIGSEHNRSFGSLEGIRHEKADLVRWLPETGLAVINADDPHVRWMASQTRARIVTFGFDQNADVSASGYRLDWPDGSRWTLRTSEGERPMRTQLFGRHMVYPILASVAVAQAEGLPLDAVVERLERLDASGCRIEPRRLPNGAIVIRDDCKSATETIDTAFDVMADVPARRRILVLAAISEPMGPKRAILRRLGERSAGIFTQAILLMDDSHRSFVSGARAKGLSKEAMVQARGVHDVVDALPADLGPDDVVLIKGRPSERLERIMLMLEGRTVRCALTFCDAKMVRCGKCPMLESGWPEEGKSRLIHGDLEMDDA